ncbi:response regulator [Solitalea canadensis]|uniref:Response regulator containing a CheY-like receiver domain and an HTH DNA-binding domain n=1 Tax=Solitalea canadensis (strain ATCC 29591 / DSM 3403 / JCM 21819 / LMG 8368 / NBRC 15130 / NCIMB 12057 / USAM 9D) TaxID=929556 RepID=H8KRT4_SOLCM|nr:response regulator transcription factor [Solitalea canadensis]AFD07722.1 response regulator containing a CheY-like receiver domain and an HTH DNA-binding domain [Solitalea canadensis DSM 3403]
MIKVAIADDHIMVINGLKMMLENNSNMEVISSSINARELLETLISVQPDVLLLDIQMPGMSGLDLCPIITKQYPSIGVIALTNFEQSHYVKQMIRNGAMGYLLKNTDQETLIAAIEAVHNGQQYIDQHIQKLLLEESISGRKTSIYEIPLTKREKEILKLIAEEKTNQQIADSLFISLRTVETHRLNLTQKLNIKNTAGLVKEAIKRGLI